MEMIAVMRCPRPEHRLELAARIAPDMAEEFTFGELAAPSLERCSKQKVSGVL
jgi:hypothetical protein